MPLVSVVLTSFNHAAYLREAIDSVLEQTFQDFELIIWDDASIDGSWKVIESYSDPRIKAYRNETNLGPVYGVNFSIQHVASGDFIAIHHSDDVWFKNKLEKQLEIFDANPALGAVFCNALAIDSSGDPLEDQNHFYVTIFNQPNRGRFEWIRYFIDHGNALCHPSLLIKSECYRKCGMYADYYGQTPDFDMWFRLLLDYEIYVIPEALVKFRVHPGETNTSGWRADTRRQYSYETHALLKNLLKIEKFDDLCGIFPEAFKFRRDTQENVKFALASVMLELYGQPSNQLFSLELMRSLLSDATIVNQLRTSYSFTGNDFTGLTKKYDLFSLEDLRDKQHSIDLLGIEINKIVHERELLKKDLDAQLRTAAAIRTDANALKDRVQSLQFSLKTYQNSTSWRITKPLRYLNHLIQKLYRWLGRRVSFGIIHGEKWVRSIALQAGLFDSAYYLHENQDVRLANVSPIDHYFNQGWREGRDPSRKFSVCSYLEKNPDIRWSEIEPVTHYLTKGLAEGRSAFTVEGKVLQVTIPPTMIALIFKGIQAAKTNPDLFAKFVQEARRGGLRYALSLVKGKVKKQTIGNTDRIVKMADQHSKNAIIYDRLKVVPFYTNPYDRNAQVSLEDSNVAVHLHLYYEDMLDLCVTYLQNIPVAFDLFVSVPATIDADSIQKNLCFNLVNAQNVYVEHVPNRGRDISPLIVQFGKRLLGYDYVAHFHTKKSPHAATLDRWFEDIMDQLCGSSAQIAQVFKLLKHDAKIVYPAGNQIMAWDQTGWSDNKGIARYLLRSYTALDIEDFPYVEFPQGSMFWAKSAAIADLLTMPLVFLDFPEEPIEADATIAHALERLVLIVASNYPGRAYRLESDALSTKSLHFFEAQQDFSQKIVHKNIKVLAYYLPQFHPTPENDEWHGLGFTEWHKVGAANPLFVGHYQQHIPHPDIGYYHLESGAQLKKQAALMHKSGVYGMIFYHYWFSGRLILEKPARMLLDDRNIDMPFCFCWANENWTRRWDGNEQEILLGQNYSAEDALEFIRYLIPFFKDPRYIKVEGRPMLFVYRPSSIKNHCEEYLAAWAQECAHHGLPAPYIVATLTRGASNPEEFGMDAAVERVLHDWTDGAVPDISDTLQPFWPMEGSVLDYQSVASHYMSKSVDRSFTHFRSLVPVWDNTARYGSSAYLLNNFNPQTMQTWMERLIFETEESLPPDRQFIIANAWNEWAEGAHLEPDTRFGYAYLNVIGRALSGLSFNETCHLDTPQTLLNLCLEPQIVERLGGDRELKDKFIACITRAAEKARVRFVSEMPEHQRTLARLGIDCGANEPGTVSLSLVFSEVTLFSEDALKSMLQMAERHKGFYICANLINHPAFIYNPALPNFSVGYWERSGMELRPARICIGYKVCPEAPCCRVAHGSDYSGALSQRRKVATIIRFHGQGDIKQLVNALLSLIAQGDCQVQPWLALQDISDSNFANLKTIVDRLPWCLGYEPVYRRYFSTVENRDLRSLMLNETLKAVGSGYLAFLDYDDVMFPEAYGYLVSRLEKTRKNATFGRVYSTTVDEDGLVLNRETEFIAGHTYQEFLIRNHAPLHSFMVNLDLINLSAIVFHADMKYMEDYFLTLQIFGQDSTDWDSLREERFIGDYIHRQGCDNHTLALVDEAEKKALLAYGPYMICEERIVEMRRRVIMANSASSF